MSLKVHTASPPAVEPHVVTHRLGPRRADIPPPEAHPTTPLPEAHPDNPPPPAGTVGRYPVAGEIARGGMGAVLRGHDPDLGRDLAIKVLLEQGDDPDLV